MSDGPLCMACFSHAAIISIGMKWFSLRLCEDCYLKLRDAVVEFERKHEDTPVAPVKRKK